MRNRRDLPAPGTLVGKYRIVRPLGTGGMGLVVQATHVELGHEVALKILRHDPGITDETLRRFQREAQVAAQLRSEHVARVVDCGESDIGSYLVMELLLGHDLAHELVRRERLPAAEAVDLVLQACEGVAHAHAAGLVHRDLKPANLFLAERPGKPPILKVLDFGITKAPTPTGQDTFTPTPTFFGTPRYTSPEQVRSAKLVDARTDQHALGMILYELLTGTPAFEGEALAVAVNICTKPRPNPCQTIRDLPAGLGAAVVRAMAEERDARFRDLAELANAIAPYGGPKAFDHVTAISSVLQVSAPLRDPRKEDASTGRHAAIVAAANTSPFDDTAATLRGHTHPAAPRAQRRSRAPWVVLGVAIAFGFGGVTWSIANGPRAELDTAHPRLAARAAALAPAVATEPKPTEPPPAPESAAPPPTVTPPQPTAPAAARPEPVRTPGPPVKKPDPAPPPAPSPAASEQSRKPRTVFDAP